MSDIIPNSKTVKAYLYGGTLEMTTGNGLQKQSIKVIKGKRYVNLETGEIKAMNTDNKTRQDNLKSTRQTMKKLRRLVAHNFTGGGVNQLWLTLTYREHVTDTTKVYKDFKAFIRRIRSHFGHVEYVAVLEPQATGRWHLHVLMKNDNELTIPNDILAQLWGNGYTKTKRLRSSDKVGNYLVAYLSNLQLDSHDSTNTKAVVKGARLYMYPKGVRIYRTSRGIEKPLEVTTTKIELMETYKINRPPNFSKTTTHITPYGSKEYTTEFYDNLKTPSDTFAFVPDEVENNNTED